MLTHKVPMCMGKGLFLLSMYELWLNLLGLNWSVVINK